MNRRTLSALLVTLAILVVLVGIALTGEQTRTSSTTLLFPGEGRDQRYQPAHRDRPR
ncbi:MAG: hypothetical protein R3F24_04285 [Gammaproteobacteria bacterium]